MIEVSLIFSILTTKSSLLSNPEDIVESYLVFDNEYLSSKTSTL